MVPSTRRLVQDRLWRTARNAGARLNVLPHKSGTHDGAPPAHLVEAARSYFRDYCDFAELGADGFAGMSILEIGPGNNLLLPLLLLANGAGQVVCIDRFQSAPDPQTSDEAYRLLWSELSDDQRARCATFFGGGRLTPSRDASAPLVYLWDCPLETAPARLGERRFDLVLSRSVLEHVYSLADAMDALRRLLRPGARMVHKVDFRSHEEETEVHPLEFLCHPPALWRLMTSHTGEPNRVRKGAFLDLVRQHGFDLRRVTVTHRVPADLVAEIRPHLARPFRDLSDEELIDTGIFIDAQRPA